jgi:AcrR family transcriptional regulator
MFGMTASCGYYDSVMSVVQPSGRPPHPTGAAVLAAAEDLFAREGAQGLSVRRIADSLGVSRQIVYSRFGGKPDLVRALHDEGFRRLTAAFAAAPGPPGSTMHVLSMSAAYRDTALAWPALYGLMFGSPVAEFVPDAAARAVAVASFQPVVNAARAWLQVHGGPSEDDEVFALARSVWAANHGLVSLELAGLLSAASVPPMMEAMVRALLEAWLPALDVRQPDTPPVQVPAAGS